MNKGQHTRGIATQQYRAQVIQNLEANAPPTAASNRRKPKKPVTFDRQETLEPSSLAHHEMSEEKRHAIHLAQWLRSNQGDPAIQVSFALMFIWPMLMAL
ncbi:MAG TPA: hypothetical protein VGO47_01560 [Chlamydiales bacterium]|nr:hypothetical protein [Chlamydiales bacterium]